MGLLGFKQIEPKEQKKRKNRKNPTAKIFFFLFFFKGKIPALVILWPLVSFTFWGAVGRCLGDRALLDFGCFSASSFTIHLELRVHIGVQRPLETAWAEEGIGEG